MGKSTKRKCRECGYEYKNGQITHTCPGKEIKEKSEKPFPEIKDVEQPKIKAKKAKK